MTAPIAQALTDTANLAALVKPKTEENGSASIFDDLVVTLSHVDGSDGAQSKSSPVSPAPAGSVPATALESNTAQPPAGIDAANVAGARVSSGGAIQPGSAPTDSAAQDNRAAAFALAPATFSNAEVDGTAPAATASGAASAASRKPDASPAGVPISNKNLALRVRATAAYAESVALAKAAQATEPVSAPQQNDATQSVTSTPVKAAETTPQAALPTIDGSLLMAGIPAITNSGSNPATARDGVPGQGGAATSSADDANTATHAEGAAITGAPEPVATSQSVPGVLPQEPSSSAGVAFGGNSGTNAPPSLEPAPRSTNTGTTPVQAAPQPINDPQAPANANASAADLVALSTSSSNPTADAQDIPPAQGSTNIGIGANDAASGSSSSTAPAIAQTGPNTPFNLFTNGAAAAIAATTLAGAPNAAAGVSAQAPTADPKVGKLPASAARTGNRTDVGAKPSNADGQAQPTDAKTDTSGVLTNNAPAQTQDTPSRSAAASTSVSTSTPHPANAENSPAANPLPQTSVTAHVFASVDTTGAIAGATLLGGAAAADAPLRLEFTTLAGLPDTAADMSALALRIAAKSAAGESEFTVRLDPPDLGRIEVTLNVDSQGAAQANLTADKPQTLELLQRDAPTLERALKDIGLDLAGGLSFSLKSDGQPADGRGAQAWGQGSPRQIAPVDSSSSNAATTAGFIATDWGADSSSSRLDIRV
jgi:flagellar hook-length control protein FliK